MAGKTNQPVFGRLIIKADTFLCLVHLIYLLVQIAVAESAIVMMVERTKGKAELIRHLYIIRYLRTHIVISTITQTHTGVLILQRIAGTDIYNTTNGITTIQRTLRTTQHLN